MDESMIEYKMRFAMLQALDEELDDCLAKRFAMLAYNGADRTLCIETDRNKSEIKINRIQKTISRNYRGATKALAADRGDGGLPSN